jgi:hypothetical protein
MKIETDPMADPPFRPVIRLSIAELDELRKQLDELLGKGFIKPSTSPYEEGRFLAYVCGL